MGIFSFRSNGDKSGEVAKLPLKPEGELLHSSSDFQTDTVLAAYDAALNIARDIENPNRYTLLKYYDNAMLRNAHIRSVISLRADRVLSIPYHITLSKDVENGKLLTDSIEFNKLVRFIFDAIFYGNSLIQISGDSVDNMTVELVPRANVIPEFKGIKTNDMSYSPDYSYDTEDYYNLVDVNADFDARELGLLATLSRYDVLYNYGVTNWGRGMESFVKPLVLATSASNDLGERNRLAKMLSNLSRTDWMIKNPADKVEFQNRNVPSNPDIYKTFLTTIEDEVSKLVLGGTMLTRDGASYSQAQVQNTGSMMITKSDMRFITYTINNYVIPVLNRLKILNDESAMFAFDQNEVLNVDEMLKVDSMLGQIYDLPAEYYAERYNVDAKYLIKK